MPAIARTDPSVHQNQAQVEGIHVRALATQAPLPTSGHSIWEMHGADFCAHQRTKSRRARANPHVHFLGRGADAYVAIADMHSHFGIINRPTLPNADLADELCAQRVALIARRPWNKWDRSMASQ